jgi:hypothetical protein
LDRTLDSVLGRNIVFVSHLDDRATTKISANIKTPKNHQTITKEQHCAREDEEYFSVLTKDERKKLTEILIKTAELNKLTKFPVE